MINTLTKLRILNYIGSIGPIILVNIYRLSIQAMKCMIKLLLLLGRHLASRVIKQLNEQIATAVLNINRCYNMLFHTAWPHSLLCIVILFAVMSCMEVGLAMQD